MWFYSNMNLPDPQSYQDGVLYFHDTHKIILHECAELESLLADAESQGVFQSFATRPEWNDIFDFFQKAAPRHELEEDEFLFPAVAAHVPRVGFQQPGSTIRFLTEGHEVLQRNMEVLVHDWEAFRNILRDAASLGEAHATHSSEDARFIATGRELARLYREHISLEETQVYSIAGKLLSGVEKLELMDLIRESYADEVVTSGFVFDEPHFSDPAYNIVPSSTEAVSEDTFEPEEEMDEDDGDEDHQDDYSGSDVQNL
jgi:hemerythrin-like domain-containing protein